MNRKICFYIFAIFFVLFFYKSIDIYAKNFDKEQGNIESAIDYVSVAATVNNLKTTIIPYKQLICDNNELEAVMTIYSTNIEINKVLELAFTKIGYPYSQPLRELDGYYDCSSFVRRMYQEITGVNIGSTTYDISKNLWNYQVTFSDLQPGDLLWQEGHIAMYIGKEQIIHASGTPDCVAVESMYEPRLHFTNAFRAINYINEVKQK